MVGSIELVAALSSGHKIGLAVIGASFIVFALVSSFVLPRQNPNFPGKYVGLYVTVSALFFIAMITAVLVFGQEKKGAEHASESSTPAATTTSPAPPPTNTTAGASGGNGASGSSGGTKGDPVAGKQVFTSQGCVGCHTLKDANATGKVGPDLDQLKPTFAAVQHQVEVGGGPMPAFKNSLSQQKIDDVAAYVSSVAGK